MSKFSISSSKNNSNTLFGDFPNNFLSKSSSVSASLLINLLLKEYNAVRI